MSTEPFVPPRPDAPFPPQGTPPVSPPGDRQPATWGWLEAVLVYVIAFVIAGLATIPFIAIMGEDDDLATLAATVAAALVIIGVLVGWLSKFHRGWLAVMRLPERGRWGKELLTGALFGLGLYPTAVFVVGGLVVVVLNLISGDAVQAPEQVPENLSATGVALTILYAIVIAPVGEELFFRGILFRSLRDRHGRAVGIGGSALAFGLIHFIPGPAADAALLMLVMVFTGAALAYLYERRGTVVAPIAAHMTFNVIGLVLILGLR
ncbi:MAG TPA: CPBP family intramembrane glutamic endopeptidase [Actinomycetota bacterium]|jgi:membrane protease YdiL (CAAX protease family)